MYYDLRVTIGLTRFTCALIGASRNKICATDELNDWTFGFSTRTSGNEWLYSSDWNVRNKNNSPVFADWDQRSCVMCVEIKTPSALNVGYHYRNESSTARAGLALNRNKTQRVQGVYVIGNETGNDSERNRWENRHVRRCFSPKASVENDFRLPQRPGVFATQTLQVRTRADHFGWPDLWPVSSFII
jgi:hypothetical protein